MQKESNDFNNKEFSRNLSPQHPSASQRNRINTEFLGGQNSNSRYSGSKEKLLKVKIDDKSDFGTTNFLDNIEHEVATHDALVAFVKD